MFIAGGLLPRMQLPGVDSVVAAVVFLASVVLDIMAMTLCAAYVARLIVPLGMLFSVVPRWLMFAPLGGTVWARTFPMAMSMQSTPRKL